ncbi:MAG TPA: helix-turn-helix transcriptional regulator [Ktedonobacteraceae bacterium]|jgi:DNA-binding XRE family transcriptional regulator|nr:helix-turn-helix transcriptional regulator [Ktedonobacteraceae bacterium]HZS78346.1 helix-turn-helix transcriptional regulator [Ktedonobacteraceae bacterium]
MSVIERLYRTLALVIFVSIRYYQLYETYEHSTQVSDMNLMTEYTVLDARVELNINQQALAKEAHVDQATISNIENGRVTRAITARKVWRAINRLREQQGLPPLKFDDISWNLA